MGIKAWATDKLPKKKIVVALLAAGLVAAPLTAKADVWGDILGVIKQVVDLCVQQLQQLITQTQTIESEHTKDRQVEADQQGQNRQQQAVIWEGTATPPGTAGDVSAAGTPGGINKVGSDAQAQMHATSVALAKQMDNPPPVAKYYSDAASWIRDTSQEQRAKILTPASFTPGEVMTQDQHDMADKNCKLLASLVPAPDLQDSAKKTVGGQEYVVKRAQINSVSLSAYEACRRYDMSDTEMKAYQDVLTQFTPDYINGLNAGSSIKTQLQLTAVMAKMQLSQYAAQLRQERMLSVVAAQTSAKDMRDNLRKLQANMPINVAPAGGQ